MQNRVLKIVIVAVSAAVMTGGIFWTVKAVQTGAATTGIVAGILFSTTAALVAIRALLTPSGKSKRTINIKALISVGGLISVAFLVMGVAILISSLDDIMLFFPGVIFCVAGALLLNDVLGGRLFRSKAHDEETLRAWDELEQMGKNAHGRKVLACPRCKELVYDDEDICEHCGNIFVHNFEQSNNKKGNKRK